jgi:hypothetical protein
MKVAIGRGGPASPGGTGGASFVLAMVSSSVLPFISRATER